MRAMISYLVFLYILFHSSNGVFKLTILHTNDMHDRWQQTSKYGGSSCSQEDADADKCYGGIARIAAKVKEIRGQGQNVILLDAGDVYVGTTWFHTYGGLAAAHFMNIVQYDAMALGNHEFDNGLDGLMPYMNNVTFPVLSCNIKADPKSPFGQAIKRHVILTIGGEKIGLIGYTTLETVAISSPGPTLTFEDEVTAIKREIIILRSQNINKIIAVGHSGFKRDQEIAEQVAGLDVIVGGHSNTFLYSGTPPSNESPESEYPHIVTQKSGAKVLVVQDYAYTKYLGHLAVAWDDNGDVASWSGNPLLMDNSVPQDMDVETEVAKWAVKVKAIDAEVVSETCVYLSNDNRRCRYTECNIGNLVSDALLYKYSKNYKTSQSWTDVSMSWMNSGGIRSSLVQGQITRGDVIRVFPFRNTAVLLELAGHYIRAALEHSVKDFNGENGKFPQLSGFNVVFDVTKPNGKRVISVNVLCSHCTVPQFEPLDDDRIYKLITLNYLANGGDGFTMFKENRVSLLDYGDIDTDVLVEYMKKFKPIFAQDGLGRIKVITTKPPVNVSESCLKVTVKAGEAITTPVAWCTASHSGHIWGVVIVIMLHFVVNFCC